MALRILLSPPDMSGDERDELLRAFDSNWIAPAGPHLDQFENLVATRTNRRHAVALASGTAALHLALIALGIGKGDEVFVSTLTFAATANAVHHAGATPVFVDASPDTWNMDLDLVEVELESRVRRGARLPRAIIPVDLYGRCVDYTRLQTLADEYGFAVVSDAAESLGASHRGKPAGSFGDIATLSFNGNKIITTGGGGMLVSNNAEYASIARRLATQARQPARHYEHTEIGYNYRLPNLLAAVGVAQLRQLDDKVERRRQTNAAYRRDLSVLRGIAFPALDGEGRDTCWLTCFTLDPASAPGRDQVIDALEVARIESRPTWKPMHLQPVFADARVIGGDVAAHIFEQGLCVPSGSNLTEADRLEVCEVIRHEWES